MCHTKHGALKVKERVSEEIRQKVIDERIKGKDLKTISEQLNVIVTIAAWYSEV